MGKKIFDVISVLVLIVSIIGVVSLMAYVIIYDIEFAIAIGLGITLSIIILIAIHGLFVIADWISNRKCKTEKDNVEWV